MASNNNNSDLHNNNREQRWQHQPPSRATPRHVTARLFVSSLAATFRMTASQRDQSILMGAKPIRTITSTIPRFMLVALSDNSTQSAKRPGPSPASTGRTRLILLLLLANLRGMRQMQSF